MTKISFFATWLLASVSAFGAASCGARSRYSEPLNPLFVDASPLLNATVQVRGLMYWTFENRNLFPPGTNAEHLSSKACLPLLITSDNRALLDLAKKKDGHVVSVSGRIVKVAPSGMVSVTTCKQVGIEVISID